MTSEIKDIDQEHIDLLWGYIDIDSAIQDAIKSGELSKIRFFIKNFEVEPSNTKYLYWALEAEEMEIAEFFFEKVGDSIEKEGYQILSDLCQYFKPLAVNFLLEHGVKPYFGNDKSTSKPFINQMAFLFRWRRFSSNEDPEPPTVLILQLLVKYELKPNSPEYFQKACQYNMVDVVELLVREGADIRANNYRALTIAAKEGHTEIVNLLEKALARQILKLNVKSASKI